MAVSPQEGHDLVAPLVPRPRPRGRVVVVPHAGAGPHTLLPVVCGLPPSVEVVGVTLPGRERRIDADPTRTPSDPGALVAALHDELAALPALPTLLFGHSLGAAISAAVAAYAPRHYAGAVLSAVPGHGSPAQRAGRWSDAELVELLRGGGVTPDDVLSQPAWREHLVAVLRSDLTLAVRLVALMEAAQSQGTTIPVTRVPTVLLAGADDAIACPPAEVRILGGQRPRVLPGGHFYLLDEPNAQVVGGLMAELLGEAGIATVA